MTVVRAGVLALQGDVREHRRALESLGAEVVEVRVPSHLADVDALVLPGGESTTMNLLLDSSGLLGPLNELVRSGMPVLGTCAGMILLARDVIDGRPGQPSFGAIDIAVRRNGFGRQVASFETDLEVKGLDEPMHAVFIRAPIVERVGASVDVLAEVEVESVRHPAACSQGPVIVASFHPELTGDTRLHAMLLEHLQGE